MSIELVKIRRSLRVVRLLLKSVPWFRCKAPRSVMGGTWKDTLYTDTKQQKNIQNITENIYNQSKTTQEKKNTEEI